ncbi:MAG: ribosome small subunit-dependent GTPase A [Tissierellia bacterium]|jgi:ribosome biogenesis GTPase|nr:ribosome small subunit-dependent GTPase A [Tissierellia bacterium]
MIKRGRILKGIGGFYYVKSSDDTIYESRASSLFRIRNLTPTVGDYVEFELTDDNKAYIKDIIDRKNLFLRPPVSNVDEVLLIVSIKEPKYNTQLIDRMILLSRYNGVEPKLIINKSDLDSVGASILAKNYEEAGFEVHVTSCDDKKSIEEIKNLISKKTIVFMGTSGVGKSTLISHLTDLKLETGQVSKKTSRGKHTTRHVELLEYNKDSYIVDTPGFSSLVLDFITDIFELERLYFEFENFGMCKFSNCMHINEPQCVVKLALDEGKLADFRYQNYLYFNEEISKRR